MSVSRLCIALAFCVIAVPAFAQNGGEDCTLAQGIAEGSFDFDTTLAVLDGPTDCDGNMAPDLWFLYTATNNGAARINTCTTIGSLTDTVLIVYDGVVCPLPGDPCLASDDDTCTATSGANPFASEVIIPVVAGQTYLIQVGGWVGGTGTGTLLVAGIEGNCNDGIDDDLDGLVDCADPDCANACNEALNCGDGVDNDLDGDIDCLDLDCIGVGPCNEAQNCADGIDNDLDGDTDCVDLDCVGNAACLEQGNCADGIDNDLDGDLDCLDVDCALDINCIPAAPNDECVNAIAVGEGVFTFNNTGTPIDGPNTCDAQMTTDVWYLYTATSDGDAVIDTCQSTTLVDTTLIVYDGALGCPLPGDLCLAADDDTCVAAGGVNPFNSRVTIPVIAGNTYLVQAGGWLGTTGDGALSIEIHEAAADCFDGLDNDGDGLTDCADSDCFVACDESQNCLDGIDNDADGDIDCVDADCAGSSDCIEAGNCGDGIDNDLDGLIDCADTADCALAAVCQPLAPNDECATATPVGEGVFAFNNINAPITGPTTCDGNMSTDVWYLYTATGDGVAVIGTCGAPGTLTDTTLIVYDGALGCPLVGDPGLACDDDTCSSQASPNNFMSQVSIPVLTGQQLLVQIGGWNGTTGTSELTIEFVEGNCLDGLDDDGDGFIDCQDDDCINEPTCVVAPATGISCLDSGTSVDATWIASTGGPGATSQDIFENGVFVSNEPMTTTSWSVPYVAGFTGIVEVCVETLFGQNPSAQACCSAGIGGPANDNCANAEIATLGVQATGNLTVATNDGTATCGASAANNDAWYEFSAPADGTYVFSTCGTHDGFGGGQDLGMDTVLSLIDVCGGVQIVCDDDAGPPPCPGSDIGILRDSVVSLAMLSGESVLARVSHFGATISTGDYVFQVTQDCGDLGVANCVADAGAGTVTVSWTDNVQATVGYEIFENGVSVGTAPAGSSSFIVAAPTSGLNNYDVTWICGLSGVAGAGASCSATVVAPIPAGTTDVIIKNEGILDGGNLGQIDSGAALALALTNAGSTVFTVSTANFDAAGLDFSIPARIWCCFGTFPNDYRITAAEGDLLATLNAGGTGIYFEGGDHWGFIHTVSGFDTRDGVSTALDGNDTFTAMDPVAGNTVADLTAFLPGTVYNQDQVGNDWTDQLTLATTDLDVSLAEPMWTLAGGGYTTAIYAEHTSGANSIVQSWEFGGFGGDQDALAAAYLGLIGGVVVPPGDQFVRANCNGDAATNIADAIFALGILFPGPSGPNVPPCASACDANDDNALNIADAIFILGLLFPGPSGPPPLPAPVTCGVDPTPGGLLDCLAFPPCVP